jgi:hypothetical protein
MIPDDISNCSCADAPRAKAEASRHAERPHGCA